MNIYHSSGLNIFNNLLSTDDFFKYLYSNEWNAGCSLRVSNGQLLDELLLGLYRMESQGRTVRHSTYAIAKNNRPRHGCYKLANKEVGGITFFNMLKFAPTEFKTRINNASEVKNLSSACSQTVYSLRTIRLNIWKNSYSSTLGESQRY